MDKMKIKSLETKYYLVISGKGLITSLGIKNIRRSKKKKKSSYANTTVSLKDISKIINQFEGFHFEGFVRKSYKHVPNESYFYKAIQLSKCMMRFNMRVLPVRMQMTNTQKRNNYKISTQKIPNSQICSFEKN